MKCRNLEKLDQTAVIDPLFSVRQVQSHSEQKGGKIFDPFNIPILAIAIALALVTTCGRKRYAIPTTGGKTIRHKNLRKDTVVSYE